MDKRSERAVSSSTVSRRSLVTHGDSGGPCWREAEGSGAAGVCGQEREENV